MGTLPGHVKVAVPAGGMALFDMRTPLLSPKHSQDHSAAGSLTNTQPALDESTIGTWLSVVRLLDAHPTTVTISFCGWILASKQVTPSALSIVRLLAGIWHTGMPNTNGSPRENYIFTYGAPNSRDGGLKHEV